MHCINNICAIRPRACSYFRICGCGKGEAGCRVCGQCQICTGDPLPENHSLEEVAELEKIVALYECGRKKVERLNEEMDIHCKNMHASLIHLNFMLMCNFI